MRKAIFHRCNYMEDDSVEALGYLKDCLRDLQLSSLGNVTDAGILSLIQMRSVDNLVSFKDIFKL